MKALMNERGSGGLGLFAVLGIVFIILKLVGTISWPWILVLAPFWVYFIFWLIFYGGVITIITLIAIAIAKLE